MTLYELYYIQDSLGDANTVSVDMVRRQLYQKLTSNPSLIELHDLESFYSELESSTEAELSDIEVLWSEYFESDSMVQVYLDAYYSGLDSLHQLMSIQEGDTSLDMHSSINAQDSIVSLFYDDLSDELQDEHNRDSVILDDIEDILDNMTTSTAIHADEKEMWQLLVALVRADTFALSTSELAKVRNLASGCPHTDGLGVYLARTLLPADEQIVHDDEDCADVNERRASDKESISSTSIYPNPVEDHIFIDTDKNIESWSILDAAGRLQQNGGSLAGSINVSNFASGAYVVIINYTDGTSERLKSVKK